MPTTVLLCRSRNGGLEHEFSDSHTITQHTATFQHQHTSVLFLKLDLADDDYISGRLPTHSITILFFPLGSIQRRS